jgi:hypothetical protein
LLQLSHFMAEPQATNGAGLKMQRFQWYFGWNSPSN